MNNIYGECIHGNNLATCVKCKFGEDYSDIMITGENFNNNPKVAIRKGCLNNQCLCDGSCHEIIGYRDKIQGEL